MLAARTADLAAPGGPDAVLECDEALQRAQDDATRLAESVADAADPARLRNSPAGASTERRPQPPVAAPHEPNWTKVSREVDLRTQRAQDEAAGLAQLLPAGSSEGPGRAGAGAGPEAQ